MLLLLLNGWKMTYKKVKREELAPYILPVCQTCGKPADVVYSDRVGIPRSHCARHHCDDIDKRGLGTTSKVFVEAMTVEKQKQAEMGVEAYKMQSLKMAQAFIRSLG